MDLDVLRGEFEMAGPDLVHRATGKVAGWTSPNGYRRVKCNGKILLAHRISWALANGRPPLQLIDHINGDRLDNRPENLREATRRANAQNMGNRAQYPGAKKLRSGRWQARICVDGCNVSIGTYDTPEEATEAYEYVKAQLHPAWRGA